MEIAIDAKCTAMEIGVDAMENGAKQTLGQDEASREAGLEAGLEAMEIGVDAMENGAKQTLG